MMHFGKLKATQLKCKGVDVQLQLVPYGAGCPGTMTPHHLIPDRCTTGMVGYSHSKAPCICVQGKNQHTGSHRGCHRIFDPVERFYQKPKKFTYAMARNTAARSAGGGRTPPKKLSKKELDCVTAQLDEYYKKAPMGGPGLKNQDEVTTSGAPGKVNEQWPAVQASGGQVPEP